MKQRPGGMAGSPGAPTVLRQRLMRGAAGGGAGKGRSGADRGRRARTLEIKISLPGEWSWLGVWAAGARLLVWMAAAWTGLGKGRRLGLMMAGAVLVLGATGWGVYSWLGRLAARPGTSMGVQAGKTQGAAAVPTNQKPEFRTLVPVGKKIDALGGWAKVSPPGQDAVFAYVDVIDGVRVQVSQQELPETLKKDTGAKVAELAAQFSATEKVKAGDVTAYVGTSGHGPQSVVMAKDGLLILIKSAKKLEAEQWEVYLKSLQ